MTKQKSKRARKPILSLFRRKIDDQKYEHDSKLDRELDKYGIKLIKVVGIAGIVIGIGILIAFWVWVIRWLYQVW